MSLLADVLNSNARTKRAIALLLAAALAVLVVVVPVAILFGPWACLGSLTALSGTIRGLRRRPKP